MNEYMSTVCNCVKGDCCRGTGEREAERFVTVTISNVLLKTHSDVKR